MRGKALSDRTQPPHPTPLRIGESRPSRPRAHRSHQALLAGDFARDDSVTRSSKKQPDGKAGKKPDGRDLRLDLFRGLANWAIFLDHIPDNLVNWITTRNYGFSDAADIFVFISGYTAAFVYARVMRQEGFLPAAARILKRAWQIYVAHVFLFVIYLGEIAYLAATTKNSSFVEEFNVLGFLNDPDVVLTQGLL